MAERLGRYTLEMRLAVGGMAEVFLARRAPGDPPCVVKRMLSHLTPDETFIRMFFDEARLAAQLSHPNIAKVFDFGEANGQYFLAMEYVPGSSLRKIVKDHAARDAFIPAPLCARLIADAAGALQYAHTANGIDGKPLNIIHRDVSPQNILLSSAGVVKLIDFGVAKASIATQKTQTGMVKGKFAYMSPEQMRGQPLDTRSDLYALGLVLYELLASRRAIPGDNDAQVMANAMRKAIDPLPKIRSDIPPALLAIVERSLQKDPFLRFETAASMQAELQRFLMSGGTTVTRSEVTSLVVLGDNPPGGETPSSARVGVAERPASGSFVESQSNAMTEIDSNLLANGLPAPRPPQSTIQTTEREIPPGLVARSRRPPEERATTDERPAKKTPPAVAAGESSASIVAAALPRSRAPWIALGVAFLAAGAVGAWRLTRDLPATPTVASPAPEAPKPEAPIATPPIVQAEMTPVPYPAKAHAPGPTSRPARANGTLIATSTPSVAVTVDGRPEGRTPLKLPMSYGDHTVTFRDEDLGLSHTDHVEVGREGEAHVDWRPGKGTVVFRAMPYAEVFMGSKSLGLTPLDPLELWEGKHSFRFFNRETNRTESREVNVKPGQQVIVKVDLRAPQ